MRFIYLDEVKRGFLNLFFPSFCIQCEKRLSPLEYLFCPDCWEEVVYYKTLPEDNIYPVCLYEGPIKKAIHSFKYQKKEYLASYLSLFLSDYFYINFRHNDFDIIVPVPLFRRQGKERGFNQSLLLAKYLSKEVSLPLFINNLIRIKDTPSQTSLSRKERLKNVSGAFSIRKKEVFKGKRVLLIDDVSTTGATVLACKRVLRKAGAKKVIALVLAKSSF